MSETEIVDAEQEMKALAPCFGSWSSTDKACTSECELRTRCESHSSIAAKPKPKPPTKEEIEELPEMEPQDYLIESLKGRYDVLTKKTKKGLMIAARKDGKAVIKVIIVSSGKTLIEVVPTGAKLQLSKLESCRQVLNITKALLVL